MGHDSGGGRLTLDRSGDIVLAWRNRWQAALYRSQRRLDPLLARLLGARLRHPPTWSLLRRTTTVHPIGGVPSGADRTSGVVDEFGEVHGHPGLFVMDGSTLPGSTGVNPSATILAATERSVQELIRRDGNHHWRAPEWDAVSRAFAPEDAAFAFAADLRESTRGGGVVFRERMRTAGRDASAVALELTVQSRSIDVLFGDPHHVLAVEGTIDAAGIVREAAIGGMLSLFPEDDTAAMRYTLRFRDGADRAWTSTGTKTLTGRAPWRIVRDLTRLPALVHLDDAPEDATSTTLRIGLRDLVRMPGSIRGQGFTRARRIWTTLRFIGFFMHATARRSWGVKRTTSSP
jgi:cholesterol oxidase